MDFLLIILAIGFAVVRYVLPTMARNENNKQQGQQAAPKQEAQFSETQRPAAARTAPYTSAYGRPRAATKHETAPIQHQKQISFDEGRSTMWSDEAHYTARQGPRQKSRMDTSIDTTLSTSMEATMGRRHVLEASSLTGHAHTEANALEECPPASYVTAEGVVSGTDGPGLSAQALGLLTRNPTALVQGILFNEVLGKPKALRR